MVSGCERQYWTGRNRRMGEQGGGAVAVCWLRNDLRYHDNEALQVAHSSAARVVPVYVFDPRHFQTTYHHGFPKTGPHRARFLRESILDLRTILRAKGSDLVVRVGKPEEVVPGLLRTLRCAKTILCYQQEVTQEEVEVEAGVRGGSSQARVHTCWGTTLYHKDDLPFPITGVPDTYTNFRKAVESRSRVRPPITMPDRLKPLPPGLDPGPIPSLAQLGVKEEPNDPRTAFPFPGGETAGLARVQSYLWTTNNVARYKETRNGLLGTDYSTKFSPWLALGCVSPRLVHAEIRRYERQRTANDSTYWVIFELTWRDYFRFVCLKFGDKVFYPSGIKGKKMKWNTDPKLFKAWSEGQTGIPFVDANMRELAATGWMSNRGRQNMASFLVKDLELDWRLGAEWFESQLLDHDVCSNYGNWNYAAGIGNDPRENRKFNMVKQALDYDYEGEYVRTWVPELGAITSSRVHAPWKLATTDLARAGVHLGQDYPAPVVVAPEWSRHEGKGTPKSSGGRGRGRGRGAQWTSPGKGAQRGIDFYFKSASPNKVQ